MEAGRGLDALVAEKVLGFQHIEIHCSKTILKFDGLVPKEFAEKLANLKRIQSEIKLPEVPKFSTDIAAAWAVVERFGRFDLILGGNGKWCAMFLCSLDRSFAKTAPHAICLAALRAKGVEV